MGFPSFLIHTELVLLVHSHQLGNNHLFSIWGKVGWRCWWWWSDILSVSPRITVGTRYGGRARVFDNPMHEDCGLSCYRFTLALELRSLILSYLYTFDQLDVIMYIMQICIDRHMTIAFLAPYNCKASAR